MRRTEMRQEIRMMRFEEVYWGWNNKTLGQWEVELAGPSIFFRALPIWKIYASNSGNNHVYCP